MWVGSHECCLIIELFQTVTRPPPLRAGVGGGKQQTSQSSREKVSGQAGATSLQQSDNAEQDNSQ